MLPIKPLALCGLLLCGSTAAAELNLAADYWDYRVAGEVQRGDDVQDLETDFGVEARENLAYRLAWNTGPGWWRPDLAASHTPLQAGGQRNSGSGLRFGPVVLLPGGTAIGDAALDDTDLSLRYPLRLGHGTVWGGLTIKRIAGTVTVRDASDTQEDRQRIDQTFPLLHAAASLPLNSWLTLGVQGNAAKYRDDQAYELRAGLSCGLVGPLGINLGWQLKRYRVNDGDYRLDARLAGAQAGLYLSLR